MTTLHKAAQQALEALENTSPLGFNMESDKKFYAAIIALRAALAQKAEINVPVPNGLAQSDAEFWLRHRADIIEACRAHGLTIVTTAHGVHLMQLGKIEAQQADPAPGWCKHCKQYSIEEPLPAQQAEPELMLNGLTKEETAATASVFGLTQQAEPKTNWCGETCERAKLCAICARELAGVQAEPVAWRYKAMIGSPWSLSDDGYYVSCKRDQRYIVEPLYTAPPQRKPLTEEEIYEMYSEPSSDAEMVEFARAIERAHGIGGDDGQAAALRLADELDAFPENGADPGLMWESAAELRRLHAQRDALLEALKKVTTAQTLSAYGMALHDARAAIKAVEENT